MEKTTFLCTRASSNKKPCEEAARIQHNGREIWAVEFADLPELLAFIEKYGDCVIESKSMNGGLYGIMIYDDYIE